jgi:hypothetical protein
MVRAHLHRRYQAPEWALLEEVRNATGHATNERYADAVAMNLWPSRGMEVLGFEIKVRRGDWLTELKNPAKSAPIQKFCDRWWVIAGGSNIVHAEEVPETWGLMAVGSGRLMICKEAPKLEPQPLDRGFVASILRRAFESLSAAKQGDDLYKRGYAEGLEIGKESSTWSSKSDAQALHRLRTEVAAFEKSSGLSISRYHGRSLGEAVLVVQRLLQQPLDVAESLRNAQRPLELALETLRTLEALSKLSDTKVVLPCAPP